MKSGSSTFKNTVHKLKHSNAIILINKSAILFLHALGLTLVCKPQSLIFCFYTGHLKND